MKEHLFESLEEAGLFLKESIQNDLQRQINIYDQAVLILPGGNNIRSFFPYLIDLDVDWKRVAIGLSDERCVSLEDSMSNERQLRECFLSHLPKYNYHPLNQDFVHKIQEIAPITLLSMGIDGHVASLFSEESSEWGAMGVSLYKTKKQNPNRVGLSKEALLLSDKIYILARGPERLERLNEIKEASFYLGDVYEKAVMIKVLK